MKQRKGGEMETINFRIWKKGTFERIYFNAKNIPSDTKVWFENIGGHAEFCKRGFLNTIQEDGLFEEMENQGYKFNMKFSELLKISK